MEILFGIVMELTGLLQVFAPDGPLRNFDPKPKHLLGLDGLLAIVFLAILAVSTGIILVKTLL